MNANTDEELVVRVQEGDIHAFEELVHRYQRGLLAFSYRIVHNEALGQEIVQDALVSLYKTIDRVDTTRKFSTYMFEITKNTAFSALRKQKNDISLDEIVEAGEDSSFYELFIQADTQQTVRDAVNKLADKYKHVVRLYYFDDLSYEEVSAKLKLPINTVRTHLKRAKEQLKKILS